MFKAFNANQCLKIIAELNNRVDVIVMNGKTAADRGAMLIIKIKRMNSWCRGFAIKPISAETIVDKLTNIFLKERQLTN